MKCRKLIFTALISLFIPLFATTSAMAESATKEKCISHVQAAVKAAVEQGEQEALKQVADPSCPFVWKNSYVIGVSADQCITLAHPIKPKLVGKNLLHVKDVNGVLIFASIAKVASSDAGKGWVDYMWPKPGEKVPAQKHTTWKKYLARIWPLLQDITNNISSIGGQEKMKHLLLFSFSHHFLKTT